MTSYTLDADNLTSNIFNLGTPAKNTVQKWNGTSWVPATYNYDFVFSIATFDDAQTTPQLIGSGVWKAIGALAFTATYNNGPPASASIALTGTTGWTTLALSTPFASVVTTAATNYPAAKDSTVTFTLTATSGEVSNLAHTLIFRNNIKFGITTLTTGWVSADINALTGTTLSNVYTGTVGTINSSTGQYVLFAHPATYTAINTNGFIFNSVTCPFQAGVAVSVTNPAGFVENYTVYRSTNANLGNFPLVTSTSSSLIDPIYWGTLNKASGYTEADVEGLVGGSNAVSNTKGRSFTVNAATGYYIVYALPVRLGTVTFTVGGFEGGFNAPETVSVTNVNGYAENYYVYVSTNSGLGSTNVVVT